MSVAISWANKMQLAKCDIMVGFPISSHIFCVQHNTNSTGFCYTFQLNATPPTNVHTLYNYLQKCLPHEDILLKLLSHS